MPAAAADVVAAYGPEFPVIQDAVVPTLPEALAAVPRGMPYVLCVLTPPRDIALDPDVLDRGTLGADEWQRPSPRTVHVRTVRRHQRASGPRHTARRIAPSPNGSASSTNRSRCAWTRGCRSTRSGARDSDTCCGAAAHVLTLERGVSLVWFGRDGGPSRPYYAAGVFAAEPRYRVPVATLQLAEKAMDRSADSPKHYGPLARTLKA